MDGQTNKQIDRHKNNNLLSQFLARNKNRHLLLAGNGFNYCLLRPHAKWYGSDGSRVVQIELECSLAYF